MQIRYCVTGLLLLCLTVRLIYRTCVAKEYDYEDGE